jgi:hypothetical protein
MSCTETPVYNFELVMGDDKIKKFRQKDSEGVPMSQLGYEIHMECSKAPQFNRQATLSLTETGVFTFFFVRDDTDFLLDTFSRRSYPYDIVRTELEGYDLLPKRETLFSGEIIVEKRVIV